jgi:lysophospholipase L1-like esterase
VELRASGSAGSAGSAGRLRVVFAALALALVTLAVCAVLLELGVLVLRGEQPRFPRRVVGAPFGVRINEPNAVYRHKSADVEVWFRINGQGLRADRDYPYAKPPGVRRIVSLGDSFTAGYEVQGDETFSSVLERALRERGYDVEVLNAGVSGYSTAEAVLYLERELLRYEPDLVLVSFFGNDLVDNTRTGLFRLEDGALVQTADRYVPGGAVGDFLNRNAVFSWLSERSNAFVLIKEAITQTMKRRMVQENLANVADAAGQGGAAGTEGQRALAGALFERFYRDAHERGIPLVIQSIPSPPVQPGGELIELFPLGSFAVEREGLAFFPAREVLASYNGKELLYHLRSHGHWTPLAHRLSGEGLARLIDERGLLGPRPAAAAPGP